LQGENNIFLRKKNGKAEKLPTIYIEEKTEATQTEY